MPLEFHYHEHLGEECRQDGHHSSCAPNAVGFDCQATSSGLCSCLEIIDTDAALMLAPANRLSRQAWELNGLVLNHRGRISTPSRNPKPSTALPGGHIDEVLARGFKLLADAAPPNPAVEETGEKRPEPLAELELAIAVLEGLGLNRPGGRVAHEHHEHEH